MEPDEHQQWLPAYEGSVDDFISVGCQYNIPNVIEVYTAVATHWYEHVFTSAFLQCQSGISGMASSYDNLGFKVKRHLNQSDKSAFISLWQTDGIFGVLMSGHGNLDTGAFVADPINHNSVAPSDVS